jgi:hypothetical protein
MPISDYRHIPQVLDEVYALQPERTLELGIGFGKWGVLLREVLDAIYGRCRPEQWRRGIWGVEGFPAYRNPCWDVYSNVDINDFRKEGSFNRGWDLVMMMDSLEHLEPKEGADFLAGLVEHNKQVIISVPNGLMPQDEAVYGNELEKHRTTFHGPEFDRYNHKVLHLGLCRVVSIRGNR